MAKLTKTLTKRVTDLLTKFPELKDDDNRLIANIWHIECKKLEVQNSLHAFFETFSKGKLSSPESIRRTRQKLQQNHVILRGNSWQERKGGRQTNFVKDLGKI